MYRTYSTGTASPPGNRCVREEAERRLADVAPPGEAPLGHAIYEPIPCVDGTLAFTRESGAERLLMVTALRPIGGAPEDWVRDAFPQPGQSLIEPAPPCAVFRPAP